MRNVGVSCGIITFIWGPHDCALLFFVLANHILKVMTAATEFVIAFVYNLVLYNIFRAST